MYAITGITGKVGGELARNLLAAGQRVRAIVRNASKVEEWAALGCEVALAKMEDGLALADAFTGATATFILAPPEFDPEPGYPEARAVIDGVVGGVMRIRRYLGLCAAVLVASMSASYAGPCLHEIGTMQARIDAKLEAIAAAGPPATADAMEGPNSPQPTPRSIARVLERMGEIRPETVRAIQQGMARARAADTNSDKAACDQALAEVQRNLSQ